MMFFGWIDFKEDPSCKKLKRKYYRIKILMSVKAIKGKKGEKRLNSFGERRKKFFHYCCSGGVYVVGKKAGIYCELK